MRKERVKISSATRQVIIVIAVILLFRILFVNTYQLIAENHNIALTDFLSAIYSDWLSLLLIVGGNVGFMVFVSRQMYDKRYPLGRIAALLAFVFVFSAVVTLVVNRRAIADGQWSTLWSGGCLLASYLASLLLDVILVVILYLLVYIRQSNIAFTKERSKKQKAQYQYTQLKQQLNPHFLFNSLNILDYLVNNGEKERASDFIKKLAGTYRYLLNKENFEDVTLSEELHFVSMYTDLLKERFTDGLDVRIDVEERYMDRRVVPCGLQMLVENATKHNIVSSDRPLTVRITVENGKVVVTNNLQPRINPYDSTGVGLKNIARQYADITGRQIEIEKSENEFVVRLPLI